MHPLVVIALVVVAVASLALRWIPAGHCLVVVRRGRVLRVVGPGATLVDPVRDHATLLALGPQEVSLVVRGSTADGHEVVLLGRLDYTVSDPAVAAGTVVDADATTASVAEDLLTAYVAGSTLDRISAPDAEDREGLLATMNLRCTLWGVTVTGLRVDEVDVRLVTP